MAKPSKAMISTCARRVLRQRLRLAGGFTIRRCGTGLYAERSCLKPEMGRIVQAIGFGDLESFMRWCDADSARHNYPLECSNLRRAGRELFAQSPTHEDAR